MHRRRKDLATILSHRNQFDWYNHSYYRHVFDDFNKRKYKKKVLISKIELSFKTAYGETAKYKRVKPKFDGFTNESGKLICCPNTRLIKVNIHDHGEVPIPVPCGKCPYCLHKKQNEWIFRARNELAYNKSSWFVTLTYRNEDLPEDEKVNKRDIQLFFKRLRKCFKFKVKLKYYVTAEYGAKRGRPHYHILLFFKHIKPTRKLLIKVLNATWQKGRVNISELNNNSICYATKYCNKLSKYFEPDKFDITEFRQVSHGFGEDWIYDNLESCRSKLNFYYDNFTRSGRLKRYSVSLPRYYKNKVFNDVELYDIILNYLISDSYKEKVDILTNKDYSRFQRLQYLSNNYNYNAYINYKERTSKDIF